MKILIVGSEGFIGNALYKYAVNCGHEVHGCDIILNYTKSNYYILNIDSPQFNDIFLTESFDICINCAGASNVSYSIQSPLNDFQANTVLVFGLLNAILASKSSCKFLNLSSAAVYGNPLSLPINENHRLEPISPYGFHKKFAEEICSEYYSIFNVETCSVRIFSAYGPGLKKQLLWDLYQKFINFPEIELFGTGEETRDFIYIDDLVKAILTVGKKATFNGGCYNIASGKETSIKQIAEIFFNKTNFDGKYWFNGANLKGYPINWKADIAKLSEIGFNASTTIDNGIEKYVKWLKEGR